MAALVAFAAIIAGTDRVVNFTDHLLTRHTDYFRFRYCGSAAPLAVVLVV